MEAPYWTSEPLILCRIEYFFLYQDSFPSLGDKVEHWHPLRTQEDTSWNLYIYYTKWPRIAGFF